MVGDAEKTALIEAMEQYERAVREAFRAADQRAAGAIEAEAYQEFVRKMDAARLHLKGVRVSVFGQS